MCLSIFPTSCLWFFLEPLTKGNDNYSFLRKLLETIKQTVDAQDPDAPEASKVSKKTGSLPKLLVFVALSPQNIYAVCDLAMGVLTTKVCIYTVCMESLSLHSLPCLYDLRCS